MKPHLIKSLAAVALGLAATASLHASNLTTATSQSSGATWNDAIWKTNGTGTAVSPVAGNTYEVLSGGLVRSINNNGASTFASPETFPGDSLKLDGVGDGGTSTSDGAIRLKGHVGATGGPSATNYYNFGAVGGLILNGGFVGNGNQIISIIESATTVAANSAIVCAQDPVTPNSTASQPNSGFSSLQFTGALSGSGNLYLGNAVLGSQAGANFANIPNFAFSGNGSGYSGTITVVAGWLQAGSANAFTNANITIAGTAPTYVLATSVTGPAEFDASVSGFISSGTLSIQNTNSFLLLDNNMVFGAGIIDGNTLASGIYTAAQINAITGKTNVVDGTGTHTLTVGLAAPTPPTITSQPSSTVVFSNGTAKFNVSAASLIVEGLTYAWQTTNGTTTTLTDNPPHLTGTTSATLVVSNVSALDVNNYRVIVTGATTHLSTTSSVVSLKITTPNAYETAVAAANPVAFYAFNETNDPSPGGVVCFDSMGNFNGLYGTAAQNAFNGVAGPRPSDGFPNFPTTNAAGLFVHSNGVSKVTLPAFNLNTNTVTFSAWIYPTEPESGSRGIVFCRNGGSGGSGTGLNYNSTLVNGDYQLGYDWGDDANTLNFQSGLFVPTNQWSLVALSVTSTNATLCVINTNGIQVAVNTHNHAVQAFSANTLIGYDNSDFGGGAHVFNGSIDEVAIFNSSLSQAQLLAQYGSASGNTNFPPIITSQPLPVSLYAGGVATFTVSANGVPAYQWYKGSVSPANALTNGLTASGSTIFGAASPNANSASLIISNVAAGDAGNYMVVLTNSVGSLTSSVVALTIVVPSDSYDAAVVAAHPAYYYPLDETNDPASGNAVAFDFVGANNGIYGVNVQNGNPNYNIAGPRPSDGFPSFSTTNAAALFPGDGALPNGVINTPGWNLNTNTLTITAWVNPIDRISVPYGIVMCRPGTGTAFGGLNFSSVQSGGDNDLSYNWGDAAATTNWVSGLIVPVGQWSFVAVSITATNATLYLINANGITNAVNTFSHTSLAFSAPVTIGGDSLNEINIDPHNRTFPGVIDNVAIFKSALSSNQIVALASGSTNFPPSIVMSPTNLTLFQGQTAQFAVQANGSPNPHYQWQVQTSGSYNNITDGGQFSGSQSPTLTISSVDFPNATNYIVVVTNLSGSITSAPALLTVVPVPPATNHTLSFGGSPLIQGQGTNWDTTNYWTPAGASATASVAASPLDTFEVQANALLRTPTAAATFPGISLTIDGNGVFNSGGSATIGELRLKATPMTFPKLVMNGGQIDVSSGGGALSTVVINGEIDILASTPFYDDSTNDQGYTINAYLKGSGNIELHDQGYALTNGITMNIAGNTNTYSGTWNVVQGTLLGTGANALGTNTITVGATGALETTYNINNTNASLILNGVMLLHQSDTFHAVTIGGNQLSAGTYPFASLTNTYAANFPASWNLQTGSSVTNGSGNIIVLTGPSTGPPVLQAPIFTGGKLILTWSNGSTLQSATNVTGPWNPVIGATSPYTNTVSPAVPDLFFRVKQ